MQSMLALLLLAVPFAAGIQFTSPAGGESFEQGQELTVEWASVDTDPSSLSLYLWNFAIFPPFFELLALDVGTVTGSTTVLLPCDTVASDQYQISAINGTNVYVIYAQTKVFTIVPGDCSPSTSITSAPGYVTVTVTAEVTCGSNGTAGVVTTPKPSYPSSTSFYSPTSTFSFVTVNSGVGLVLSWQVMVLCMGMVGVQLM